MGLNFKLKGKGKNPEDNDEHWQRAMFCVVGISY